MKILVTGGSSDIAKSIICSDEFNAHEFHITCSTEESLEKTLGFYEENCSKAVRGFVFNFNEPILQYTDLNYDALILNAASVQARIKPLDQLEDKEIKNTLNDIWGNIKMIKSCLATMKKNNFGRIIFVSSLSTVQGTTCYAPYIAAKAALEGVVKNIAVDYSKSNILANTIRLGLFKTSRNKFLWKRSFYQKKVNGLTLQSRMGEPSDIIGPIKLFLSENLYTTGSALDLGGGLPITNPLSEVK